MDQFQLFFLIYVENGAIRGTESAKLTGCFVSRAYSRYMWSFYRHNKNRYMKKGKGGPGPETEKYHILFTAKYMKLPPHMHALFVSHCNVTCSAREWQYRSCRVVLVLEFCESVLQVFLSRINCILFKFEGSFPGDAVCCFPRVCPCQNAERDGCANSE